MMKSGEMTAIAGSAMIQNLGEVHGVSVTSRRKEGYAQNISVFGSPGLVVEVHALCNANEWGMPREGGRGRTK
jgi:hypothetical protein